MNEQLNSKAGEVGSSGWLGQKSISAIIKLLQNRTKPRYRLLILLLVTVGINEMNLFESRASIVKPIPASLSNMAPHFQNLGFKFGGIHEAEIKSQSSAFDGVGTLPAQLNI